MAFDKNLRKSVSKDMDRLEGEQEATYLERKKRIKKDVKERRERIALSLASKGLTYRDRH